MRLKEADAIWQAKRVNVSSSLEIGMPQTRAPVLRSIALWKLVLLVVGPGLVVLLANTDTQCLVG